MFLSYFLYFDPFALAKIFQFEYELLTVSIVTKNIYKIFNAKRMGKHYLLPLTDIVDLIEFGPQLLENRPIVSFGRASTNPDAHHHIKIHSHGSKYLSKSKFHREIQCMARIRYGRRQKTVVNHNVKGNFRVSSVFSSQFWKIYQNNVT